MKRIYKSLTSRVARVKRIRKISISRSVYLNLIQAGIGVSIFLGVVSSALGWYGLATGKGIIFTVEPGPISIDPSTVKTGPISIDPVLSSLLTVVIGSMLTFEGIFLTRAILRVPRLTIFSIVLGYCSLNIPAILLGLNYSLAAGISAIIFGYLWLVTVLAWLQRGE